MPAKPVSLGRHSLLIVEDSEPNRELYQAFLEDLPLAVTYADTGSQALECFASGRFDAVVMDLRLPDMDGLAVIREIRRREATQAGHAPVPILVVTAYAFREESGRAYEAGCNALLTKPIQKGRLLEALSQLLSRPEDAEETGIASDAWTTQPVAD